MRWEPTACTLYGINSNAHGEIEGLIRGLEFLEECLVARIIFAMLAPQRAVLTPPQIDILFSLAAYAIDITQYATRQVSDPREWR